MNNGQGHVTESNTGSLDRNTGSRNMNGSVPTFEEHPWKRCNVDIEDEELIREVTENSSAVTDPLKHVDVNETGLHIWRVKGGALIHWRREDYGQFYDKDCFLIFHIQDLSHHEDQPVWTLHLWMGQHVTEMTFRQAAYSTVTMAGARLNSKAVVHREAQGHETMTFRRYFSSITYLKGSSDESYWCTTRMRGMHQSRLLKCYRPDAKSNRYTFTEVPPSAGQLDTSFVYILDLGKQLYQWNGDLCKTEDVLRATRYVQQIKCSRGSEIKVDTVSERTEEEYTHPFYMFLSHKSYLTEDDQDETQNTLSLSSSSSSRRSTGVGIKGVLFRLTNDKGRLQFKKVKNGILTRKDVSKEISCIVDLDNLCILWFSLKVAAQERGIGLVIAQEYLRHSAHPTVPVIIITEGQLSVELDRTLYR
ncbi:hypothetical protein LSH36_1032g00009 [Paralvinella palmiformis]|uniref:Gelsolin-like domain-containing protein n=1 Tax=Paralvinella palmiformis TaxID=53620 RepID=A0AAD9MQM7_9ANNE|nr:hypothetical protein LSH36_1032g00009 [Paralvinella palmiformis]